VAKKDGSVITLKQINPSLMHIFAKWSSFQVIDGPIKISILF